MAEPVVAPALVLGIGNPDRGDDGVGRVVARTLRSFAPTGVEIAEAAGDATALLERIERRQRVLIIDACVTGAPSGVVHRFDAAAAPLPAQAFDLSSHGLGLHHALELARTLGVLPHDCLVYAIEGARFEVGAPLSPAVAAAATELARTLMKELEPSAGGAACTRPA